jgi:predicted nuclease of predicted toxin-antitoxin system
MKFKLDENFGRRTQNLFQIAGHDVQTTLDEKIQGCSDRQLYQTCCAESRCLVTLDLDFSDVTRFPPERSAGIAVIRVHRNPSLAILEKLISLLLQGLSKMSIENKLWIVEMTRIRIHQSDAEGI